MLEVLTCLLDSQLQLAARDGGGRCDGGTFRFGSLSVQRGFEDTVLVQATTDMNWSFVVCRHPTPNTSCGLCHPVSEDPRKYS